MANETKTSDCDECGSDSVEVTSFAERWFCPYCMVSFIGMTSEGKTLSCMFNELEKRLLEKLK